MRLDQIVIGERVRKDMGDLKGLAESIKRHGLLHPVVVKADKTLVAGHRRVEAVKLLGWDTVPVTPIDVEDLLSAERDENAERKDFTPTEAVAIGALIEERERPHAEQARRDAGRKAHAVRRGDAVAGQYPTTRLSVADKAAAALGMERKRYTRAKEIVAAAAADPEKFGDLPAQMDETQNVLGTHRELLRRRENNPTRHAIHAGTHYPQANKMAEKLVTTLDGVCLALAEIKVAELEPKQIAAWARSLEKSINTLKRFHKEMKGCQS